MKVIVEVDPVARTTYVSLSERPVARTISVSDLVLVDVDERDDPVGVEFVALPGDITTEMLHRLADRFMDLKPLQQDHAWLYTGAARAESAVRRAGRSG